MTSSGWTRLTNEFALDAVSWWFYRQFDDGFAYSRGGRVRSARAARKMIRHCWDASIAEHTVYVLSRRPRHRLGPEGELVPQPVPPRSYL